MDESLEGVAYLLALLEGNAGVMATLTGGVFPLQAPDGATPPYAVIQPMAGRDREGVAGYRLFWEGVIAVRYWGAATQMDGVKTAANAGDALIHLSKGFTNLAQIMSCIRQSPLPPLPDWTGQSLRVGIGGLYRLQVRAL